MNARYTSPDLSKQLAEAGLEQNCSGDYWHRNPGLADDEDPWFTARWDDPECGNSSVRALRLDEVLEELTRDREGGPLCGGDLSMNWLPFVPAGDWQVICAGWHETSDSAVEAAGLVLLALMRERGGK